MRKLLGVLLILTILTSTHAFPAQSQSVPDLPPQVIDLYPFPGTEMREREPLTVTFNQAMDRASVEAAFQLDPPLAGDFHWPDNRTLSFTPTERWLVGVTYELTVTTTTLAANGLILEYPYREQIHTVGPLLIGEFTPAPDATDVDIDSPILVSFNRPVVPFVSTEQLADLPNPLSIEPPIEGATEWLNTSMLLFTPSEPLRGSTTYTVTIDMGLTAIDGATLAEDVVWQFTTRAPEVVSIYPGVSPDNYWYQRSIQRLDTPVTVTFSQPMDRDSAEKAFSLVHIETEEPVAGSFTWNEDNTEFTFQPDDLLQLNTNLVNHGSSTYAATPHTNYRVTVAQTAQAEYGGEPLPAEHIEEFATFPLPGVCDVSYGQKWLGKKFDDEPVEPGWFPVISFCSTMNLTTLADRIIIDPAPENWELVQFWDEGQSAPLRFNTKQHTTYTVTVLAGTEDIYGNAIEEDYTFSFTTGALPTYAYPIPQDRYVPTTRFITSAYRENTVFPMGISGTPDVEFELYELPLLPYDSNEDDPPKHLIRAWNESLDSGNTGNVPANVNLASPEGGTLPLGRYALKIRLTSQLA